MNDHNWGKFAACWFNPVAWLPPFRVGNFYTLRKTKQKNDVQIMMHAALTVPKALKSLSPDLRLLIAGTDGA